MASVMVPGIVPFRNSCDKVLSSSKTNLTTSFVNHRQGFLTAGQMQVFDSRLVSAERIQMSWGGALASIRLIVQGKNLELTESLKAYVEEKVGRAIHNHSYLVMKVDVRLSIRGGESGKGPKLQRCEVTMFTKKHGVVRAEEETDSMYSAIDNVSDVITRKLRKIKERDSQVKKLPLVAKASAASSQQDDSDEPDTTEIEQIVRTKYFDMPPVKTSDALAYMANVGHDFYAFRNAESGQVNILYKRKEGGFGIIIPTDEETSNNSSDSGAPGVE